MFHEQRLNFGRSDTKTFVFDHFFLTVDDVGVALSIDMSDIAGVKPAVAQGTSRFFGGFPVALHDLRAANDDLAVFPSRQLALSGLKINYLLFGVVDRHANAVEAYQSGITRLGVCKGGCFGQAISLDNLDTCFVL